MLAYVHLLAADGFADRYWTRKSRQGQLTRRFRALSAMPQRLYLVWELREASDFLAAIAYLKDEGPAC